MLFLLLKLSRSLLEIMRDFDEADAGFGAPPDEHGALDEADGGFGD